MHKKLLLIIIILGLFVRLYRLDDLMLFVGDQGTDYLTSYRIITKHELPFLLHETSLPGVLIGPLFYYLQAIALVIGKLNPVAPAVMTSLFGTATILLIYLFGKEAFNKRVGLFASLLYSLSPLMVINNRIPIHVSIFPFFLILYMIILKRFLEGDARLLIFIILDWLILIQLHLSAVLLIPFSFLLAYIFRNKFTKNKKLNLKVAGITITLLMSILILVALKSQSILQTLINLTTKKLLSFITFRDLYITPPDYFYEILQKIFSMEILMVVIVFGLLILVGVFYLWKTRKSLSSALLLAWFTIALIGLIIKNSKAEHYFNLLVPALFFMVSVGIDSLKNRLLKAAAILALILFGLSNFYLLIKQDFYMQTGNNQSKYNYGTPLKERIKLAKFLVKSSSNRPFNIIVKGDLDIYKSTGKNYEYLSIWLGGNPSEDMKESRRYIIYEPKVYAESFKSEGKRVEFYHAIVEEQSK